MITLSKINICYNQIHSKVYSRVSAKVWGNIDNTPKNKIFDQIWNRACSQIFDQIWIQVEVQIRSNGVESHIIPDIS